MPLSAADAVDVTPIKGGSQNTPIASSFKVLHPPPLQNDSRSSGFQSVSKPMRVQSASSQLWRMPEDPTKEPLAATAAPTPRSASQRSHVPKPPGGLRPHSAATLLVRLQDNPREVIGSHLPHLAGASTVTILRELEADRMVAEEEGDLARAQERTEMLRAFAEHSGKLVERGMTAQQALPEIAEKASHYRTLMFEFTKMWEDKFQDYDEKSEAAILELQSAQQRRFEEVESLVRSELAAKKPHYSRKVITKREELDRLLSMRQYKEAERVRRDLVPLEEADETRFEESLNATLASKTRTLRRTQETKMESLRMRITQGREELMLQRRNDYFNLLLKHANGIEETELQIRRQAASHKKTLHKQLTAMLIRSSTKPVHFETLLMEA